MNEKDEKTTVRETAAADNGKEYFDIVMEAATVGDMLAAKRRLAQLYHLGQGVEQSSAEAVRWYSLAALQAMNELDATPSLKSAEAAFNILFELGELHYKIGDSQRAISTFMRMKTMLDSLPEELHSNQIDRWIQICSNKLGGLYERTARPNAAYEHFTRALEIAENIAQTDNSEITLDDLAVASYRVGFIDYLFRGQNDLLHRAYAIWEKLYEQTGNYEYRRKKGAIKTLFATADIPDPSAESPSGNADRDEPPAACIEPVSGQSSADQLSAELAEYIREHGYSMSSPLECLRPLLDTLLIIALIIICVWGYFSGTFHAISRFVREIF